MSTENIIEGNKLIAEFMKIKIDHNGRYKAGYNSLYMNKIDAAWNVCVEFIKWYNSWKEKQ